MPDYTYTLVCPACGNDVQVEFGRRSTDGSVLTWQHVGCAAPGNQRVTDFFTTSLPTDDDGTLLDPAVAQVDPIQVELTDIVSE